MVLRKEKNGKRAIKLLGKKYICISFSKLFCWTSLFLQEVRIFYVRKSLRYLARKIWTLLVEKLSVQRNYPFSEIDSIELVRNRNQRSFLTRLRVGSHNLAVELGRRTRPITPLAQRVCTQCAPPPTPLGQTPPRLSTSHSEQASIDTEFHFLMICPKFTVKRNDFFDKISYLDPKFTSLTAEQKFSTLLCAVTAQSTKLINRFIETMFVARNKTETFS